VRFSDKVVETTAGCPLQADKPPACMSLDRNGRSTSNDSSIGTTLEEVHALNRMWWVVKVSGPVQLQQAIDLSRAPPL